MVKERMLVDILGDMQVKYGCDGMVGYIYYISNTVNDKLYVGKTISTLKERMGEHCRESRRQRTEKRPLYRAMRKYGEDKFSIHLLEEVGIDRLSDREMYWINRLNTYSNGYNATCGGDGKILYDDSFEINVIVDYQNGMHVNAIAEKYNCDHTTVRKRLRSVGIQTNTNSINQRKYVVCQYDLDKNFICSFDSIHAAAQCLIDNGSKTSKIGLVSHISAVLKGKRKTCEGYIWIKE